MPLYDYRCERCGDFRAFRSMAESGAAQACPQCGVASPRRLVAPLLGNAQAASGWLSRPAARHGGAGSWRHACGFGCGCGA